MRSLASRLAMMFVARIKTDLAAQNGTDRIVTETGDSIIME
jgi:hypothetical protein